MAPHSSALAWKIPWAEEPGRLQSIGVAKSQTRLSDFTFTSLSCIGEGNGNPLHCSCLENPRDKGAWWAAVYGVTQSWTRLKRLSSSTKIVQDTHLKDGHSYTSDYGASFSPTNHDTYIRMFKEKVSAPIIYFLMPACVIK